MISYDELNFDYTTKTGKINLLIDFKYNSLKSNEIKISFNYVEIREIQKYIYLKEHSKDLLSFEPILEIYLINGEDTIKTKTAKMTRLLHNNNDTTFYTTCNSKFDFVVYVKQDNLKEKIENFMDTHEFHIQIQDLNICFPIFLCILNLSDIINVYGSNQFGANKAGSLCKNNYEFNFDIWLPLRSTLQFNDTCSKILKCLTDRKDSEKVLKFLELKMKT